MKKIPIEEIKSDALKYNSKGEWRRKSHKMYCVASERKILAECCAHMTQSIYQYIDNNGVVYAFIFEDNQVFIGSTVTQRKRFTAHINESGPVFNRIQQGLKYQYKILEDKIMNTVLLERELFYVKEFQKDESYTLINKRKGGGIGGMKVTDEQIIESARMYNTKAEWKKNAHLFVRTAYRRKIMDLACAHMDRKTKNLPLSDKKIHQKAKQYNNRTDWANHSPKSYKDAKSKNIIPECCAHMRTPKYKWTDEKIYLESQKYKTRLEWQKGSPGSYGAARRLEIYDKCVTHMVRPVNPYTDDIGVIYIFTFSDNSVYIGLSIQPEIRYKNHLTKPGPVLTKIQQEFTYEYKILEDTISNKSLADREDFYIKQYKSDPRYTLLNSNSAGARGGFNRVTNKQVFDSASKFKTKIEWMRGAYAIYQVARRRKLIDIACKHMTPLLKTWTDEDLIAEARKYNTNAEWKKKADVSYNIALGRNILHLCRSHMKEGRQHKWTNDEIFSEAKKHSDIKEWYSANMKSYRAAITHKILDECKVILGENKKRKVIE